MKKRNILLVILIVGIILLVGGTTYAAYTFSFKHKIDLTSECFDIVYAKGSDIGSNENKSTLVLSDNYRGGLSTTLKIRNNGECGIASKGIGTIYLNTEDITTDELIESGALNYQILEGFDEITSGNITSKGKIPIYDFDITTSDRIITIYVWLNIEKVNPDNVEVIINSKYRGYITVKAESR